MSEPARRSLQPLPAPPEVAELRAADGRAFEQAPRWPVTKLTGAGMTCALAVAAAAPTFLVGRRGALIALFLPVVLATAAGRITFESFAPRTPWPGARGHLVPALVAGLVSTALIAGTSSLAGGSWSPAVGGTTLVLSTGCLLAAGLVRDLEIRLRLAVRRVFFVGSREARGDLERELGRRRDASFVGGTAPQESSDPGRLIAAVIASQATMLVLDTEAMRSSALVEAASELNLRGLHVRDLVGYYEREFKKVPLAELTPTWFLFDIGQIHQRGVAAAARRARELALAVLLLLLSVPVLILAALAVRLTSRGPAIYRQVRVGRGGTPFTLHKLRTMRQHGGEHGWAQSNSHRITPVGRHLRRYRIDEIPQLWNVIRGDLSLVGPRPEQVPIVTRLEAEIPFYSARHCIRPGLTGWAQVTLGPSGSMEGTVAKLQRDLYYVKHSNLRLDALILWLTLKTVLSGGG